MSADAAAAAERVRLELEDQRDLAMTRMDEATPRASDPPARPLLSEAGHAFINVLDKDETRMKPQHAGAEVNEWRGTQGDGRQGVGACVLDACPGEQIARAAQRDAARAGCDDDDNTASICIV